MKVTILTIIIRVALYGILLKGAYEETGLYTLLMLILLVSAAEVTSVLRQPEIGESSE